MNGLSGHGTLGPEKASPRRMGRNLFPLDYPLRLHKRWKKDLTRSNIDLCASAGCGFSWALDAAAGGVGTVGVMGCPSTRPANISVGLTRTRRTIAISLGSGAGCTLAPASKRSGGMSTW